MRSDAEMADALYGDPTIAVENYRSSLTRSVDRMADAAGFTPEQREAHLTDMALTFDDARINPEQASSLHSLLIHAVTSPPDEATQRNWEIESRRQLREAYGLEEGNKRLAAAAAFVKARPALAKLLSETGAGSRPELVMAITSKTERELRMTPRTLPPKPPPPTDARKFFPKSNTNP